MKKNYKYQVKANKVAFCGDAEYSKRREVLKKVHDMFRNSNIKWGLAWSANLFFRGIIDNFHDLDIIVEPIAIPRLEEVLKNAGVEIYSKENDQCFTTSIFWKCMLDGFQIDLMSDFGMKVNQINWRYRFSEKEISYVNVQELAIPIFATEIQYLLYAILEDSWQPQRRHKRILVEEFLLNTDLNCKVVFERALLEELPEWIKNHIKVMLEL